MEGPPVSSPAIRARPTTSTTVGTQSQDKPRINVPFRLPLPLYSCGASSLVQYVRNIFCAGSYRDWAEQPRAAGSDALWTVWQRVNNRAKMVGRIMRNGANGSRV